MIRSLITVLFLFSLTVPVKAQTSVTVSGTLTNIRTGEPLAGVYIVYGRQLGTTSDEKGFYSFSTSEKRISVSFQFIGYEPEVRGA
jgi:hypothetical protein